MSFLFEKDSPLTSPEAIKLAVEYTLGSTCDEEGLVSKIETICLSELRNSGYITWDFILESLKTIVDKDHPEFSTYNEIVAAKKVSEESYVNKGIYRYSYVWPNPTTSGGISRYGLLPIARQVKLFDKKTRIISIGSCFANEVTKQLVKDGYNYLKTEKDYLCQTEHDFSANWGIVFNPLAFNQAVKYYFGLLERPPICWSSTHSGSLKFYDPFREDVTYSTLEEHEKDITRHRKAGQEAFLQAEVIFLTLGLTEIWQLRASKLALARAPYRINPIIGEYRSLEVPEIIELLNEAVSIIKERNPTIKIIATVSPVPLAASFRKGHHAIESNFLSKSKLRVAIESVAETNENVYYFPSYEITMFCHPKPWCLDERHISESAIKMVFKGLYLMYGPNQNYDDANNKVSNLLGVVAEKKRHKLTIFARKVIHRAKITFSRFFA